MAAITVGGSAPISLADVISVARGGADVVLADDVAHRLVSARRVVDTAAGADRPVYGLTTGLGAAVDTRLPENEVAAFQARAVWARAVAVGDLLTTEEVRATLFVRLCGLSRGVSGITPAFVPAIAALLNRRAHPLARRTGSLGEADLAPLAGLFLPFAGGGEIAWGGEVLPGPEALAAAGIAAPPLGPKDGIALINASAFSTAAAALAAHDLRLALDALAAAGALSLEGFRANLSPLDLRLVALRPAPGQATGTAAVRALLAGSDLFDDGEARRVQDPLSFRCLAPVHGCAIERLRDLAAAVEVELNGAGDSPAVLAETGDILSSVNFDTTALALALEAAGGAASHAAALSVFRVAKLMSPAVADLPRFLTRRGGSRSGLATAHKTAAALEAEIRRHAVPVGPMAAPVADGIEDYAPMTPLVAAKTAALARALARLAAVELVVAAVAVDLRDGVRLGRGTGRAYRFVRDRVAPWDEDRPTGGEFEAVACAIEAGELARMIGLPE